MTMEECIVVKELWCDDVLLFLVICFAMQDKHDSVGSVSYVVFLCDTWVFSCAIISMAHYCYSFVE